MNTYQHEETQVIWLAALLLALLGNVVTLVTVVWLEILSDTLLVIFLMVMGITGAVTIFYFLVLSFIRVSLTSDRLTIERRWRLFKAVYLRREIQKCELMPNSLLDKLRLSSTAIITLTHSKIYISIRDATPLCRLLNHSL